MGKRFFLIAVFGVLTLILPVAYAFGVDIGVVDASVTANDAACITIGSPAILYGSAVFSTSVTPVNKTGSVTVTSCSGSPQNILARGSNATQSGGGATWTLGAVTCPTPKDVFSHFVNEVRMTTPGNTSISMSTTSLGQTVSPSTRLTMPCTGSVGAGILMTTTLVFTATAP